MATRHATEAGDARSIELSALMQGQRRLIIQHDEKRYALKLTRQNKLILTRDEDDRRASATSDVAGQPAAPAVDGGGGDDRR